MSCPSLPPGFQIRPAVPADLSACLPLTFRALSSLLETACLPEGERPFPCAAAIAGHTASGQCAGLLLLGPPLNREPGLQVHSLMVRTAFRRQGLGRALLETAPTLTPMQPGWPLRTEWSDRLPARQAFAATLAAAGWSPPHASLLRIQGPVRHTPLMIPRREAMLARANRNGITLTPWTELTAQDRADLATACDRWEAAGDLPDWADPRPALTAAPSPYALLLRTGAGADGIGGWITCLHHTSPQRWLFPLGWVRPDLTGKGILMLTLADVTLRLHREQGPDAIAAFETSYDTPDMWALLERHFAPHAHLDGMIIDRLMSSQRRA